MAVHQRHQCTSYLWLVLAASAALLLAGCGGGGGGTARGGGGDEPAAAEVGTAHFRVDVASGEVTATPLRPADGTVGTASIFTGTAVHFNSSVLYDQAGSTGLKVLDVSLTNRSGLAIGIGPDGADLGLRVLFGAITPVTAASDLRAQVTVSTLANVPSDLPTGVTVAPDGTIYATGTNRVLRIRNGAVAVVAGDGTGGYVEGVGATARFQDPTGIARNPMDGALIVADYTRHRLRRVTPDGVTSLIAGTGVAGGANGAGNVATLNNPVGVAVDEDGVIYVSEQTGHRLRRITPTGGNPTLPASYTVSTLAGSGAAGFADGTGTGAVFSSPRGLALDANGNLYVADAGNRRVRLVKPGGQVATIAGTGASGGADGSGPTATFGSLYGITVLPDRGRGLALAVTSGGQTVRQVRLIGDDAASLGSPGNWVVQTLAGLDGASGSADGSGTNARFNTPRMVAVDGSGNLILADQGNGRLRRVRPNEGFFPIGAPTGVGGESVRLSNADEWLTVPGGGSYPAYPIRRYPSLQRDQTSAALPWAFVVPQGVTAFEFTVRVEGPTSVPAAPESGVGSTRVFVRHLAGGVRGFVDGPGTAAQFSAICGLAELNGVFYAGDYDNNAIRSIDRTGTVGTIAGVQGMGSGFIDGTGLTAKFSRPNGVLALSGADCPWPGDPRAVYLIVADDHNHAVRMLCTPTYGSTPGAGWKPSTDPAQWQVKTIAGVGSVGNADGRGDAAAFNSPAGVAALSGRTVYVSEYMGNRIRMLQWTGGSPMDPTHWQVSLVAGDNTSASPAPGNTDGFPDAARFNMPFGLAMDASGSVYVADWGNHRIRRIKPGVNVSTFAGTTAGYLDGAGTTARFQEPRDIASDSAGYLYVTDRSNHRIRRVSPTGAVTTVAGTASGGWTDGRGDVATFDQPNVLAVTASGDLCVADHNVSLGAIVRLVERVFDIGHP